MVFLDFWYLVFLPFPLLAVWLLPAGWRPNALLGFCLVFHWHYAGPAGMRPVLILAAAVYAAIRTGKHLVACGGACLAAWIYYRQPALRNALGIPESVALPLAISFFTFEFLHLVIDRASGRLHRIPGPRDFLLFILFFPSLAAGPIKRIEQFLPQCRSLGWPGMDRATMSVARIAWGFFLKLVVVSWFHSLLPKDLVHYAYSSTLLLGLHCYLYVWLDLAAYSHIAIGSARLMGITLPENLRFIPRSRSFSDFWGRWHLSVTQWFRDYVLLPVAGTGGQAGRFYLGVGLAFFFSALWHGSTFNILLWGTINAIGMVLESFAGRTRFWRRLSSGRFEKAIPWVQWSVFQPCLALQCLLFLYPVDQVIAQLGHGP